MTAEIINLRQARKTKARGDREKRAAENRAKFGRPKVERNATEGDAKRNRRIVDGARRDAPDEDKDPVS
jgi:hypothetical protein